MVKFKKKNCSKHLTTHYCKAYVMRQFLFCPNFLVHTLQRLDVFEPVLIRKREEDSGLYKGGSEDLQLYYYERLPW